MLHKELISKTEETLRLEQCPEPVQLMPPVDTAPKLPVALTVLANVLIGFLLLGSLMLIPALLASLLPFSE